jgi:DNA polymerase-3 subunit alpha
LAKFTLRGAGLYLIVGKVIIEYGCPSIEVIRCGKMPLKPDPRSE